MRIVRVVIPIALLAAVAVFAWQRRATNPSRMESHDQLASQQHDDAAVLSDPLADSQRATAPTSEDAPEPRPASNESATVAVDTPAPVETPPGVLEVQAKFADQPARDVDVEIWTASIDLTPHQSADGMPEWRTARTDAAGLVRFRDLPQAEFTIRVTFPNDIIVLRKQQLFDGTATPRVVVRLGSAIVFGRVFSPEGRPVSHARVAMAQHGGVREARTDESGDYRFESVDEELTTLTVEYRFEHQPVSVEEPLGGGRAQFVPRIGESKRIDFGDAAGMYVWSGRLMTRNGVALHWPVRIEFEEQHCGLQFTATSDSTGSFSIWMQPGEYRATTSSGARTLELGRANVRVPHFTGDLVLPDVCVWGSLHYEGARAYAKEPRPPTLIVQRIAPPSDKTFSARVKRDEYVILGLEPAVYRVRAAADSKIVGVPPEGFELDLRTSEGFEVRDLVIADP